MTAYDYTPEASAGMLEISKPAPSHHPHSKGSLGPIRRRQHKSLSADLFEK